MSDAQLSVQGAQVKKMSVQQHARHTDATEREKEIFSKLWKEIDDTEPLRYDRVMAFN